MIIPELNYDSEQIWKNIGADSENPSFRLLVSRTSMKDNFNTFGIGNVIFASTVVVLVVIAGVGYGLYATTNHSAMTETSTSSMTETMTRTQSTTETMTTTEAANQTYSYQFTAASGGMISNAWILVVPLSMDEYAVSVHAEGLESNGTYILEGSLATGSMQTVPISTESMTMNMTSASEFQSDSNGTGLYWIQLSSNPVNAFENIQLYFVPEMMMQNATLVATASFSMMSSASSMTASSSM